MSWLLRIDELTPSQNAFKRMHPRVYKKLRDRFQTWIMIAMVNGKIPKATTKRRLTITRYAKHDRYKLDRGNVVGGCKPVLDAAVRQGLILDDREEHLDDHYVQDVDPKNPRTEIRVEDLEA